MGWKQQEQRCLWCLYCFPGLYFFYFYSDLYDSSPFTKCCFRSGHLFDNFTYFQLVYETTAFNTIFSTVSIIVLCSYRPLLWSTFSLATSSPGGPLHQYLPFSFCIRWEKMWYLTFWIWHLSCYISVSIQFFFFSSQNLYNFVLLGCIKLYCTWL